MTSEEIKYSEKLYGMQLGEEWKEGSGWYVLRVPGGWIFDSRVGDYAVFVPFHNEFQR